MRERKPLMKKESNAKYVILIVFIVFALGYVAYEKLDINLKDIKVFEKKDNVEVSTQQVSNATSSIESFPDMGFITLVFAVSLFGIAIVAFIFPLFRGGAGME